MCVPGAETVEIREESGADAPAIRFVHQQAFGGDIEPRLVDMLRESGRVTLSLVAVVADKVVGHILFSPVTVELTPKNSCWTALGPIGVLPDYQGQGIGSQLVREGLAKCRQIGCDGVVLLGEPAYYSRFGFVRAGEHRLTSEYGAGPEFQAMALSPGAPGASDETRMVYFAPEFREVDPPMPRG